MVPYTQSDRPLEVKTPLGKDALLLTRFDGTEAISQLFRFHLDLLAATETPVKFDKILGQAVTVRVDQTDNRKRYFHGIVSRFTQAGRSDRGFGVFRAEVVPKFWILSKTIRSRTFQHLSVPEILRQVLIGFDVTYRLIGTYPERDYCVQYRESDFQFASRLMEEEGISYFFEHDDGSHMMIVTDRLNLMVDGQSSVIYDEEEGATASDMRITSWEKTQNLGSGDFTFWDHCFELPGNHLEAKKKLTHVVTAGTVHHKLRVGINDDWEVYDYPGPYARRFDGVDVAGIPQPQGIAHIFEDRDRAIQIKMQQEESAAIDIHGVGYCGNFSAGHKFILKRHFDADGEYLLTRVEHKAILEDYQSGDHAPFQYSNAFECVPSSVHYRPPPVTSKPLIPGVQTATVVGPPGEEIFVDKYGRVKVQFHWDREGKNDANSSCWLRVSQFWAGKGWGAFFWPRIGHEVVVAFEEGDPDQPIVMGSVYNAENMPFFKLPFCKDFAGIKSESARGNQHEHYNGIVMVDRKGEEHISIHSERHMVFNTEFDKMYKTGRYHGERVPVGRTVTVGRIPGVDGGGSGGGVSPPLAEPQPAGFVGMNSVAVYGINSQVATPLNFQLAVGSNLQLCVNPSGLAAACTAAYSMPEWLTKLGGSGVGGNLAFTLGTNTTFVVGQVLDINMGPKRIKINVNELADGNNVATAIISWVIVAACAAYIIAYEVAKRDYDRSLVVLICTTVIEVALVVLLAFQKLQYDVESKEDPTYVTGYKASSNDSHLGTQADSRGCAWATGILTVVAVAAIVTAEVLIMTGETNLQHHEDDTVAQERAANQNAREHGIPDDYRLDYQG